MKILILSVLLLGASSALSAEDPSKQKPGDGPRPPHPPRPECVDGDKAKDIFDHLDVEAKVITRGDVTITIKRSKGLSCREMSSTAGDLYICCIHPAPKDKPEPKEPPTDDSLTQF